MSAGRLCRRLVVVGVYYFGGVECGDLHVRQTEAN